jgi:hypothetical protein
MATKRAQPLKSSPTSASTSVAVKSPTGHAIINIQDALKAEALKDAGRITPGGGTQIRLSKSGFELPDGTKTPGPLEVVIVDFVTRHMFYDVKYDPKNPAPPACFATGPNQKDMTPSSNAPAPQADSCQGCPMNEFGPNGERKECNNTRMLAVLPVDATDETPIWTISVSPGALKGFDGYVSSVLRTFQVPPVGVVTSIGLLPNVDYPSLTFSNPQPNDNVAVHFGRRTEARDLLLSEPDVSGYKPPVARRAPGKTAARRA